MGEEVIIIIEDNFQEHLQVFFFFLIVNVTIELV